jgi:hypothetical protein
VVRISDEVTETNELTNHRTGLSFWYAERELHLDKGSGYGH